jgi:RNA-directed DNA polymerase
MNNRTGIFEAVCDPANLMAAWKQVRANKGAAGVDQITIAKFERDLQSNLTTLSGKVRDGR